MVSVEDANLRGGGKTFCVKIWDTAKDILSEWTGQELAYSSLYGIRVYKEHALLAPHADRLPLVVSAIINVDQDLDEPWPLEVYGHDGRAVNVTMLPGDMVLYESHSVIHGRPFPLKGRFMANLFVHFEPIGPRTEAGATPMKESLTEQRTGLPPYILPNTTSAEEWFETYPEPRRPPKTSLIAAGSSYAHFAAKEGAVDQLHAELERTGEILHHADQDGNTPLHLAVKSGHLRAVQLLIDRGADRNVRTADERQASPLWWAKALHESDHPVVQYLMEIGAADLGPEL